MVNTFNTKIQGKENAKGCEYISSKYQNLHNKELPVRNSTSYAFSKDPSDQENSTKENNISAIKRVRESKGSFCSNILENDKEVINIEGRKFK